MERPAYFMATSRELPDDIWDEVGKRLQIDAESTKDFTHIRNYRQTSKSFAESKQFASVEFSRAVKEFFKLDPNVAPTRHQKCVFAARQGNVRALEEQHLLRPSCELSFREIVVQPLNEKDFLLVMDWCIREGLSKPEIVNILCRAGRLDALKWICQGSVHIYDFYEQNGYLFSDAVNSKNIKLVKWLLENNCPDSGGFLSNTLEFAACNGDIKMIRLLYKNNCGALDERVFAGAAIFGDISICEYLLRKKCPFDESTIRAALSFQRLSVAQWLKDNGCPWPTNKLRK